MEIYVYSDESGVFDVKHNEYYVYGGVVYLSKEEKEIAERKYISAENVIYGRNKLSKSQELKASFLSNKDKGKLFRSLNSTYKFAAIVKQKDVNENVFTDKKHKQRYLDYVYKIAVKRLFEKLIKDNIIVPEDVEKLFFLVDEHTTATNGRYELRQALEREFKSGTFNYNYNVFYPPIFTKLKSVDVAYCNSKNKTLIRAADIVANRIYFKAINEEEIINKNLVITYFP